MSDSSTKRPHPPLAAPLQRSELEKQLELNYPHRERTDRVGFTSATQLVCGGAESQALFLWGKQKVLVLCRHISPETECL